MLHIEVLHLPCKAVGEHPQWLSPKFCFCLFDCRPFSFSSGPTWSGLLPPLQWRLPDPWSSHLKLSSVSFSWAHLLFKFPFGISTINFCSLSVCPFKCILRSPTIWFTFNNVTIFYFSLLPFFRQIGNLFVSSTLSNTHFTLVLLPGAPLQPLLIQNFHPQPLPHVPDHSNYSSTPNLFLVIFIFILCIQFACFLFLFSLIISHCSVFLN